LPYSCGSRIQGGRMAFLISTHELPNGGYEREIDSEIIWTVAEHGIGLTKRDYGRTWFVFESRTAYELALD
jgi:hypothetical protein